MSNQQTGRNSYQDKSTHSSPEAEAAKEIVNRVFTDLTAIHTGWRQSVQGDITQWVRHYKYNLFLALLERNINTQEMIARGMWKSRAAQTPWLPTPGEFCAWCKTDPQEMGMPGIEEAFDIARKESGKHASIREWPHIAVYLAARETGFYDLKVLEDNQRGKLKSIKERFEMHYQSLVERAINGEELQVPESRQLAYTPQKQAGLKAPEEARQSLRGLF